MMKRLRYRLTTVAPIVISSEVGDPNIIISRSFIPGGTIRGAMANIVIKEKKKENNLGKSAHTNVDFRHWFLNSGIRFTNAYIEDSVSGQSMTGFPIPFSVQKRKKEDIFHDLLFSVVEGTSHEAGFGVVSQSALYSFTVKKNLNFHHARDRATGTHLEGQIFNYECIEAGQSFVGSMVAEENILLNFLSYITKNPELYIGRSRNTQYGKVKIELLSPVPEDFEADVPSWSWQGKQSLSLTLLSDLVLYDDLGFATTDISVLVSYLKKALAADISIKQTFVRAGDIENFVSVWKLRKPSDVCFRAGSCFLITLTKPDKDKIVQLQREGLGERLGEGFGRVVFDWQDETRKTFTPGNIENSSATQPNFNAPDMTKEIVAAIVKDFLLRKFQLIGMQEAEKFDVKPLTGSLVSRLDAMFKAAGLDAFKGQLGKLRSTAKNKLSDSYNDNTDLLRFLIEKKPDMGIELNRGNAQLSKLCEKVNISPQTDSSLQEAVESAYFNGFFMKLRLMLKHEGEK